ncbi:hypothetical protein FRC09_001199 [Ceratobasidium sp. 395]|nr:hypothetical protein FRC09_001199 [Ceratobasidium sp. 395]
MPASLAQQVALNQLIQSRHSKQAHLNLSSTPRPEAPVSAANEPSSEVRRSTRARRPSIHELESQEYKARSQASSRSPSPSELKSGRRSGGKSGGKSSRKSSDKSKEKEPFGHRGARPGRIIQPVINAGTTGHNSPPEPLAADESDHGDLQVETQRDGNVRVVHVKRDKAIRLATIHTNKDASNYSTQTLHKILQQIVDEETCEGPVGSQGEDAPTQYEQARQMVLGGGHQPSANGVADDAGPEGAGAEPEEAPGAHAPGQSEVDGMDVDEPDAASPATGEPVIEEPTEENSQTEAEETQAPVKLGPGGSASQQTPDRPSAFHNTSHSHSTPKSPRTLPHTTAFPRTPHPNKSGLSDNAGENPGSATIDSDEEDTLARKRQHLAQPLHRAKPSQLGIFRPISSNAHALPLRAARHKPPPREPLANPTSGPSKPPPASDLKSALAWAVEFVEREARSRATTSQHASGSREPQSDFGLLAQVLGEIGALAESSLSLPPKVRYLPEQRRSTNFIGSHVAALEAEAAVALGKRTRRKQPSLADYPGLPGEIASLAIPELIAKAIAEGAYEGCGKNDRWAIDIFKSIATKLTGDEDVDDPPRPLRALMTRRISIFRGEAVDRVRPVTAYRHGFIIAPETLEDVRHNIELAKSLLPNDFHCANPAEGTDAYENPMMQEVLARVIFWAQDALGVVFHQKFYPIPVPTIAFALTLWQHTIGEWKTGRHVKASLDAELQGGSYQSHLLGLLTYEKEAPGRLEEFQEDAFWYGMNHAGVSEDLAEPYQPVTRPDQIRPDSPRTRARAKGKGRALA